MEPILFPYTYLTEPRYRLFRALFGPLTVYQPAENQTPATLGRWAAEGGLVIRTPVKEREAELATCIVEYTAWAAQRQGSGSQGIAGMDSQFLRHHDRSIPFFEDSAVTRLKSAIRGGAATDGKASTKPGESLEDQLFQARLFLSIAQDFDRHQWDLVRDLTAYEAQEQLLMDNLQGSRSSSVSPSESLLRPVIDSPDAYQVDTRLRAWLRLWRTDVGCRDLPGLLITPNSQVVERLEEMVPSLHSITVLDALPAQILDEASLRRRLLDWLKQLATFDGDPLAGEACPLELSAANGLLPVQLEIFMAPRYPWSAMAAPADPSPERQTSVPQVDSDGEPSVRHGVLVLVTVGERSI